MVFEGLKIQEVQIIDFPEMALRQSDNRNK